MLFNTFEFAIFFTIVFSLYLMLNHKMQNWMLLVASYFFYGWADVRFLSLLLLSTVIDYVCGIKIEDAQDPKIRRRYLIGSVVANLFLLGCFKYFNFFIDNMQYLLQWFGLSVHPLALRIALPVGISFYTFQTMSYTLDVYRGEIRATRHFSDFALFVSFFPQLVAGPIERARHLLPQVLTPRQVTVAKIKEGVFLLLWGLFEKVFVADNLAAIVDITFGSTAPYSGMSVLISLYAFAFQIYCDFDGYSNMARGLGRCMGFDIMFNFNLPYLATNPVEFWQRWHISLSTWLRDYLYIPLGGNRQGRWKTYRNVAITMLLGGLWHGAAWTFVLWGAYQGVLIIGYRMLQPILNRISLPQGRGVNEAWFSLRVIFFFHLVCLGWLIFRAPSLHQAIAMAQSLFGNFHLTNTIASSFLWWKFLSAVWLLLLIQYLQFRANDLQIMSKWPAPLRWSLYSLLFQFIAVFGAPAGGQFIYYRF